MRKKKCSAGVFAFKKKVKNSPDAFPAGQNHSSQLQSGADGPVKPS